MTKILDKTEVINQAMQELLEMMADKGKAQISVELLTTTGERVAMRVSLVSIDKVNKQ